jgi:hypothetical protein
MFNSNRAAIADDISSPSVGEGEPRTYQERKERGVCTYPGCPSSQGEESLRCPKHSELDAKRKARWRQRQAKILRVRVRKSQCLRCGGKRLSGEEHCGKCLVTMGKAERASLNSRDKNARIEAATSVDAGGRSRYRGQGRRGRQSIAATDAKDLEYAVAALRRGVDGLELAASPVVAALPRIQREDVKRASDAQLLQAYRFLGEVLARHRVIDPVAVEDED